MYEKALSIQLKKLGDDHPSVALTYYNVGSLYEDNLNKYKEALDLYQKSLSIWSVKLRQLSLRG